jgi:hypothetical protein
LRQFAVSKIHQGRFPLWAPYNFGGVPCISPKFSIFLLLEYCVKPPVLLTWVQLLAALVGGTGPFFLPASRMLGLYLAGGPAVILLIWTAVVLTRRSAS